MKRTYSKAAISPRRTTPFKKQRRTYVKPYQRSVPNLSIEKKYFDSTISNITDISAGVIVNSLNLIPQGTTDITRIGNKVTVRNVNITAFAYNDDQAGGSYAGSFLRTILFVDKQANGATAAVTDILKTANIASFRNMDQVDRFIILKDKVTPIPVNSANALHTDVSSTMWKLSNKCNIPVHFSSTTGAITELKSNNIGLLMIADTATCNASTSIGTARVKFTDL